MHGGKHSERSAAKNDLKAPEKPQTKCTGFTYLGSKAFNMLPKNIKEAQTKIFSKPCLKSGFGRTSTDIRHFIITN